jgi:type VI secretion system secreted protein VgrG
MTTTPPPAFNSAEPSLDAVYELRAGPYTAGELRVLSFEGREEMNALYAFDVVFWAKDLDEAQLEGALLGLPVALGMHLPGGSARYVRGIVHAMALEGKHPGGRHAYRLSLAPKLWFLGKRVNSRIFQDKTVQEIVDVVLAEHGVAHDWNLATKYPARQYCVQYQESDLHFVTRLLAEEGIFFSFDHPADAGGGDPVTERLVLADSAHAYAPIDGDPGLVYRHQSGEGSMQADENQVLDLRAHTRIEPTAVVMHDYDFRRPMLDLTSRAPAADAPPPAGVGAVPRPLEVYDHHGEYEETDADAGSASVYLEQLRAGAREAHGVSVCRRLLPGHRFDLRDHEIEMLDASWVVTHVHHRGVSAEGAQKKGTRVYENTFRCAPAEVPHRPPRPARLTRQVIESAVVVGPQGQEIFTDTYGRVKVQFHWDREGKRNEYSSCWMRVMQAWAGTGWGFQFIPRIGMEVVVSFLGGDLDRPVVMGCLGNAIQGPSFVLPAADTRSGIRTSSTPGGGGRYELSFDDARGREEVYLRAQRDLVQEIGGSAVSTVRSQRRETIHDLSRSDVHGNREEDTAHDRRERVGGSSISNVEQDRVLNVGGSQSTRVDGDDALKVGRDRSLEVGGANVVRVTGADVADIGGDSTAIVHGAVTRVVSKNAMLVVDESCSIAIRKALALAVGSQDEKGTASAQIAGDCQVSVEGDMEISVKKALRIRSGSNAITISPDGIKIEAESITLSAKSISAVSEKSALDVGEKVEIRGKTVKIWSADDAIIELTKDAKIDGNPALKLNGKNAAEERARDDKAPEVEKAEKVPLQLFDLQGKPIADALYEVSFPGYLNRGKASDGTIEVPKPSGVERCFVRWARPDAERPPPKEGAKRPEFEFEKEVYLSFDDPSEHENLRRKLSNLGHPDPRGLQHAVASFQSALGSEEITGKVDDVKAELDRRHTACEPAETATEKS